MLLVVYIFIVVQVRDTVNRVARISQQYIINITSRVSRVIMNS